VVPRIVRQLGGSDIPENAVFVYLTDAVARLEATPFDSIRLPLGVNGAEIMLQRSAAVLPETVFRGSLFIPESVPEEVNFAIRSALLSIESLDSRRKSDLGRIRIELLDGTILREVLYAFPDSGKGLEVASSLDSEPSETKLLIPNVEAEVLAYFARHPEELHSITPRKFEELVASIFRHDGFDVELTPESWDGGYDILAVRRQSLTGTDRLLVECKRYSPQRRVTLSVVRSLIGVVELTTATKGVVVTTSGFTWPARKLGAQRESRIVLHDFALLKQWLLAFDS
jgi:restriction system protein